MFIRLQSVKLLMASNSLLALPAGPEEQRNRPRSRPFRRSSLEEDLDDSSSDPRLARRSVSSTRYRQTVTIQLGGSSPAKHQGPSHSGSSGSSYAKCPPMTGRQGKCEARARHTRGAYHLTSGSGVWASSDQRSVGAGPRLPASMFQSDSSPPLQGTSWAGACPLTSSSSRRPRQRYLED